MGYNSGITTMGGRAGGGSRGSSGGGGSATERLNKLDAEYRKIGAKMEALGAKAYSKAYSQLEAKASNGSGQIIYSPSPSEVRPLANKILDQSKAYQKLKDQRAANIKATNKLMKEMRKKK